MYNFTAPTCDELVQLREVAAGIRDADLIIRNSQVLCVHSGEILERDILISGRHIAALTPPRYFFAKNTIDAKGHYAVPNFIDAHFHIEYSLLTPGELARLIVPKGTTTILADPNCMANVSGKDGVDFISATNAPLCILRQISSSVPRFPGLELGGYSFTPEDIGILLQSNSSVSLGEAVPYDFSLTSALVCAQALNAGKRINGHTARLQEEALWSYWAGGICDDHNAATFSEALNIIRLGGSVAIQSGSMTNYLKDILADPNHKMSELMLTQIFFCADDKTVVDLNKEGHIDHHVRTAISSGIDPTIAVRMATLNAAVHFRIDHLLGSITPSKLANFMLLPDLEHIKPTSVYVCGQIVAENGEPLFANVDAIQSKFKRTIKLNKDFGVIDLAIVAPKEKSTVPVRVIEPSEGYYKKISIENMKTADGIVQQDIERDILKIAVVDRHHASRNIGVGFIKGFGLQNGAIASCNNCENQNIVVIGTDDQQMVTAVRHLEEIGGGYCVVSENNIVDSLPLPVGGIMSDAPWSETAANLEEIEHIVKTLGCEIESPFMIMAFIGLASVPEVGLTELGLIDAAEQQFINVVV